MTTPPSLDQDLDLATERLGSRARASLWWTHVPALAGERLGVIGSFDAQSEEACRALLDQACERLAREGCTLAVGPMDGNTWRRYRLVTDPGTEPPFFLEPANPPAWPVWWRAAGFGALAEYYSTATSDLTTRDGRLSAVQERMRTLGVTLRFFRAGEFEAELRRIYEVSVVSFQENYLYTPLPEASFVGQYRALEGKLRPELVLLAEHAGKPVGYVFATPDFAEMQRGAPLRTVIVKTLAVLPGRTYAGLGALLLGEVHASAAKLGFTRAIHALMHASNRSRNLSAHYADTLRRYTLFSRRLLP